MACEDRFCQPLLYACYIKVGREVVEPFTDLLLLADILAISVLPIEDAVYREDNQVYDEPGVASQTHWQENTVEIIFTPPHTTSSEAVDINFFITGLLQGVLQVADITASQKVSILKSITTAQPVKNDNWVQNSQKQNSIIFVSDTLQIIPSWWVEEDTKNRADLADQKTVAIYLDPGLAFGSGSHASTQLCLRWLEQQKLRGKKVLDYGCGSGILGLYASKLGAQVVATDIDPLVLEVSRENAKKNQVTMEIVALNEVDTRLFDYVVANILATPLIQLAATLTGHLQRGGGLALAGILQHQAAALITAYSPHIVLQVHAQEGDWVLLAGYK